ncbi:MAG: SDR family oxidoreductase [Bythopirellula sp.]
MNPRLANKRALITGSGQGIGKATALAFCSEGAEVVATDINEESLVRLQSEEPRITTRTLDVCDSNAIDCLVDELSGIDVLMNCVGYVHHGSILDCNENNWQLSFDVNVGGMYRLTKRVLPIMIAAGGGSVINVSSVVSSVRGAPKRFAYGTMKAAIIGLTKSIASDFVQQGIRCNAICPGTVQTPSLDDRIAAQGDLDKTRSAFIARQPMGRLGLPEEIASLATYLASDESAYTTGAIHIADGGWCI